MVPVLVEIPMWVVLLSPLVLVELTIRVFAIFDINRAERRTRGLDKLGWSLIVALVTFAWIVYFLAGRDYVVSED